MNRATLRHAGLSSVAIVLCSVVGCFGGGGSDDDGSCDQLSGAWTLEGDCRAASCSVDQNGCTFTMDCSDGSTFSGSIAGSKVQFEDDENTCSGDLEDVGDPTNAPDVKGSCEYSGGSCEFKAECVSGDCAAALEGAGGTSSTGGTPGIGGSVTAAGTTSTAGTGSGGTGSAISCTPSNLTVDETGWIDGSSNSCGIQGGWYWFADAAGTVVEATAGQAPYRAGTGMCLSGSTIEDATFAAFGASIGLNLNQMDTNPLLYDAAAMGVTGFEISVSGTFTQELRFAFVADNNTMLASPFVAVAGVGVHQVLIADASVPATWDVPNAGQVADASSIMGVQLGIVGGVADAPFDVCLTSIKPITAP
jgi:hypothetical protein